MSFVSLLSLMCFPVLLLGAAKLISNDLSVFFHLPSFLVVFVGTFLIVSYSFGVSRFFTILKVYASRVLGRSRSSYSLVVRDLFELSRAKNRGEKFFSQRKISVSDYFLKDALELIEWAKNEVSASEFKSLLETRATTFHERYIRDINEFRGLIIAPIYLGFIGSIINILMMGNSVSHSLSDLANTANAVIIFLPVFYGLFIRLVFFEPVSEQVMQLAEEDFISRNIVVEGVLLMHENKPAIYIEEKLNSFVLPHERYKH